MVRPANKIAEPDKSDKKSPTDPSKSDVKIKQPYAMCQLDNGNELLSKILSSSKDSDILFTFEVGKSVNGWKVTENQNNVNE